MFIKHYLLFEHEKDETVGTTLQYNKYLMDHCNGYVKFELNYKSFNLISRF